MTVLTQYESMARLAADMAAAAREDDWERVTVLEHELAAIRDTLRVEDPPGHPRELLAEPELARKEGLIRSILDHHQEVRDRAEPRLGDLRRLLSSNRQERNVQKAYGIGL